MNIPKVLSIRNLDPIFFSMAEAIVHSADKDNNLHIESADNNDVIEKNKE